MTQKISVKKLRELLSKATPGPWNSDFCGDVWTESKDAPPEASEHGECLFRTLGTTAKGPGEIDAALIAASRNALPALLDALELAMEALNVECSCALLMPGDKCNACIAKSKINELIGE